jgi:hypothetical protein
LQNSICRRYLTDIMNMLQGFYVFVIFVCKRNVAHVVLGKKRADRLISITKRNPMSSAIMFCLDCARHKLTMQIICSNVIVGAYWLNRSRGPTLAPGGRDGAISMSEKPRTMSTRTMSTDFNTSEEE